MGVSIYPVIENSPSWAEFRASGKAFARALSIMEKAAAKSQLPSLDDFYSPNPEEADAETEVWFDSKEGLATIRFYLDTLANDRIQVEHPDRVLEDLREFERILETAMQAGLKWHLGQDL